MSASYEIYRCPHPDYVDALDYVNYVLVCHYLPPFMMRWSTLKNIRDPIRFATIVRNKVDPGTNITASAKMGVDNCQRSMYAGSRYLRKKVITYSPKSVYLTRCFSKHMRVSQF